MISCTSTYRSPRSLVCRIEIGIIRLWTLAHIKRFVWNPDRSAEGDTWGAWDRTGGSVVAKKLV